MSTPEKNYKDTILLPETSFPMRGDLTTNEPKRLEKWEKAGLYERIISRRRSQNAPSFILHDGPPFANGDVHMGTALNKILKDMVVKSKTMAGYACPFTPGWDCHGLPIEFKVVQQARDLEPAEIRTKCTEFAWNYINIQRNSFRRLGVFADWENPYLTFDPAYEADIIRVFAKLVEKGCIYQSRKPVQWSYGAHTALAEAEVEYQERVDDAIFVRMPLVDNPFNIDGCVSMVIWTTTPWTLPANVGVALHPEFTYVVGKFMKEGRIETLVVLKDLIEAFTLKTGWALSETLYTAKGRQLEGARVIHPFLPRQSVIVMAEFVTADSGTGAVHIAPGHGADDYNVGRQHGLEVISPVDDNGKFTEEVNFPELVGMHVFDSNKHIINLLDESGFLIGSEAYTHSYPHCWRSKTPIIFRAVDQFFISLDKIRETALNEIDKVSWLPAWGRNRIYGTVEARPDWCISRQRTWGVPLPVFFDQNGQVIMSAELANKVADLVEKEGSNIWFTLSDAELASRLGLPEGVKKGTDTLDVWIDSGCSHVAVLEKFPELHTPADLYLEATDQHRGWFQSSLMLSAAYRGVAPYKTVLTHGFVVNKDGSKISKSAAKTGKPTDSSYFYEKYGADIVRLWASSVDWQNDVPFGEDLFKQVTEPYRRLRNSLRILLGNLSDFNPATDAVQPAQMTLLDRWIMERLNEVIEECRKSYENFEFRKVFNQINHFCSSDLSAVYVDVTKDRMYCDSRDSVRRRATQTAMHAVFTSLSKLLAPILVYTAEEAWEHGGQEESVHEQDFPESNPDFADKSASSRVTRLFEIRSIIQRAIEAAVQAKTFNKNNEASIHLTLPKGENQDIIALLGEREFCTEFFILADLTLSMEGEELVATAARTGHPMCPRCRRYEPLIPAAGLCARCTDVCKTSC